MILESTWAEQDMRDREERQERWLASRPVCDWCGEHIQDEHWFNVYSICVCPGCFDKWSEEIKVNID